MRVEASPWAQHWQTASQSEQDPFCLSQVLLYLEKRRHRRGPRLRAGMRDVRGSASARDGAPAGLTTAPEFLQ